MSATFDRRIARASELAERYPSARDFLNFYRQLALLQKSAFKELSSNGETDVRVLVRYFPALLEFVRRSGPDALIDFGERNLGTSEARENLLLKRWDGGSNADSEEPSASDFFSRALLQPYAESLDERGHIDLQTGAATCPFCNAKPVAVVLRGEGDGAKRWLLCSMCSTEWPFRRVVCPNCGEQDKDKLPIYTASCTLCGPMVILTAIIYRERDSRNGGLKCTSRWARWAGPLGLDWGKPALYDIHHNKG
jgi:FdhE protein